MKTALYRHYDASGQLLYVGVTCDLGKRDRAHASRSSWHDAVSRTETQWCLSREHALALERVAIKYEKPLHNKTDALNRSTDFPENSSNQRLCAEFEQFISARNMSRTGFGKWAANDPSLMKDIEEGRELRWSTIRTIREKMAGAS